MTPANRKHQAKDSAATDPAPMAKPDGHKNQKSATDASAAQAAQPCFCFLPTCELCETRKASTSQSVKRKSSKMDAPATRCSCDLPTCKLCQAKLVKVEHPKPSPLPSSADSLQCEGKAAVLGCNGFVHKMSGTQVTEKVFMECCAGTCRLSSSMAERGIPTQSWEIARSQAEDTQATLRDLSVRGSHYLFENIASLCLGSRVRVQGSIAGSALCVECSPVARGSGWIGSIHCSTLCVSCDSEISKKIQSSGFRARGCQCFGWLKIRHNFTHRPPVELIERRVLGPAVSIPKFGMLYC